MPSKHCRRCRRFVPVRTRFNSGRGLKLFLCIFFTTCCTATPVPKQVIEPPPVVKRVVLDELPVAELMQIAFMQWERELWQEAATVFQIAINSGMLNDMGRVVCYWHIGQAFEKIGNIDQAAEAYFSFTMVAEDILFPTNWEHEPMPPNEEFIMGFGLREKLDYAAQYINLLWESRTK